MNRTLDPTGLVRARPDLWLGANDSKDDTASVGGPVTAPGLPRDTRLVLGGSPARYWRLRGTTLRFLFDLADLPTGMTVREAGERLPADLLHRLSSSALVDYVPPGGGAVPAGLVVELARRNIIARHQVRRVGWDAVNQMMDAPVGGRVISCRRPLAFDEIEVAARLSFGVPGTSRKCTVVALAVCAALRSRRYPARVVVMGESAQPFMHARAVVQDEPVDPNDVLLEGVPFVPFRRRERPAG